MSLLNPCAGWEDGFPALMRTEVSTLCNGTGLQDDGLAPCPSCLHRCQLLGTPVIVRVTRLDGSNVHPPRLMALESKD